MSFRVVVITVTTLVCAVAAGCADQPPAAVVRLPDGHGTGLVARVDHVVDGDTVELVFPGHPPEPARLLGIDTPETVKPDAPVECFGPEASARAKALLPEGAEVVVQRDEEPRDRYGRILVYVWRRSDGLFVNRSLLDDGYATVLSMAPNTAHRATLAAAERRARAGSRGLWGACDRPGER